MLRSGMCIGSDLGYGLGLHVCMGFANSVRVRLYVTSGKGVKKMDPALTQSVIYPYRRRMSQPEEERISCRNKLIHCVNSGYGFHVAHVAQPIRFP